MVIWVRRGNKKRGGSNKEMSKNLALFAANGKLLNSVPCWLYEIYCQWNCLDPHAKAGLWFPQIEFDRQQGIGRQSRRRRLSRFPLCNEEALALPRACCERETNLTSPWLFADAQQMNEPPVGPPSPMSSLPNTAATASGIMQKHWELTERGFATFQIGLYS